MGVNPLTLASILMKTDTTFRGLAIPFAMVSGDHSGVKLFEAHHKRFVSSLVPFIETFRLPG